MSAKTKAKDLGATADQWTVPELINEESKKNNIQFWYGVAWLWFAIVGSCAVALSAKTFDVNTWPETISSLIYNNQTTWGLAFYGPAIIGGFFLLLSMRFTLSPVGGDWGSTARLIRHYLITGSILGVVLVPSNTVHDGTTDQIIIAAFHYVFAIIPLFLYPLSELYLLYQQGDSLRGTMWKIKWTWATLLVAFTFLAVRISIAVLQWNNDTVSNALTISCFCLEVGAILMLTMMAAVAPYVTLDDDS